jgi:hypothetical protein
MPAGRTSLRRRKVQDGVDEPEQPACVTFYNSEVRMLSRREVAGVLQLGERPEDLSRVRHWCRLALATDTDQCQRSSKLVADVCNKKGVSCTPRRRAATYS